MAPKSTPVYELIRTSETRDEHPKDIPHVQPELHDQDTQTEDEQREVTAKTIQSRDPTPAHADVVVQRQRVLPVTQLLVHCFAIFFTLTVLSLNFSNIYFKPLTYPNLNSILNAFQFIAKAHEWAIGASLGLPVLHHIRYELCQGNGVPVAYITSAFQISSPVLPFSPSFWTATFGAGYGFSRRKVSRWGLGLIIWISTVLTAVVGPSSAILVIPQLDWWNVKNPFSSANGATFLVTPYEDLYPSTVDMSLFISYSCGNAPRRDCPYDGWMYIEEWAGAYLDSFLPPNFTTVESSGVTRYLTGSNIRFSFDNYSVASTVPGGFTYYTDQLWLYAQRNAWELSKFSRPLITFNLPKEKPLMKPLVQTQCGPIYETTSGDSQTVEFPHDQLRQTEGTFDLSDWTYTVENVSYFRDQVGVQLQWVDISDLAGKQTIGAIFGMPFENPGPLNFGTPVTTGTAHGLVPCVIDAKWVPVEMAFDPNTSQEILQDTPDPMEIVIDKGLMTRANDIAIDISFAMAMNPSNNNNTGDSSIVQEMWNFYSDTNVFNGELADRWQYMVATILSLSFADALARIEDGQACYIWNADPSGNLSQSYVNDLNNQNFANVTDYDTSQDFPSWARARPEEYLEITWTVDRFGYAWGFHNHTTTILATIVLLIHVVMALIHIGFTSLHAWRCESWTSPFEFYVLAVQSTAPTHGPLAEPSFEAGNKEVFSERAAVRERSDNENKIEMVFGEDISNHKKLKEGKKYV